MVTKLRGVLRLLALWLRHFYLVRVYGMDIAKTARISWQAHLDKTFPRGIHVGDESYCASGSLVLTHDFSRNIHTHTRIGRRCFVGAGAIILPGAVIGDSVIIGAGAVVTKDVPSGCVVAGNPARILRSGIHTGRFGRIEEEKDHLSLAAPRETAAGVRRRETVYARSRKREHGEYVNTSTDAP